MKIKALLIIGLCGIANLAFASSDKAQLTIINKSSGTLNFTKQANNKDILLPKAQSWNISPGSQQQITIKNTDNEELISFSGNSEGIGGLFGIYTENDQVNIHGYYAGSNIAFSWHVPYTNVIVFCDNDYFLAHHGCFD